MAMIGYARVSTEDQTSKPQLDALSEAGCKETHQEQASGGDRTRHVLGRVLDQIEQGDTLVVMRIASAGKDALAVNLIKENRGTPHDSAKCM